MALAEGELEAITGEPYIKKPAFLSDNSEHAPVDDPSIRSTDGLENTSIQKVPEEHVCDVCGKRVKSALALIGHKRSHAPKGTLSKVKEQPLDHILSDYEQLEQILRRWGVGARSEAIVEAMKYGEINDIRRLKELLIGAQVQANLRETIVQEWAQYNGLKTDVSGNVTQPQSPYAEISSTMKEAAQTKIWSKVLGGDEDRKSNPELELRLAKMEEQNKRLEELLLKKETDTKIEKLEAEVKKAKAESDSQVGSISAVMEKLIHELEKKDIQQQHNEEIKKLREEMAGSRGASNSMELADKAIGRLENVITGAGSGFAELNKRTMDYNREEMKGNQAMSMRNAGFAPDQITAIIGNQPQKPKIDLKAEYDNLQRAVGTESQPKPQPDLLEKQTAAYFNKPIKMNVEA